MSTDAPSGFSIVVDDLEGAEIRELLRLHAEGMLANSPKDACHWWRSARSELTLISLGGAKFWTFAVSGLTADDADDAERWWSAARRWGHPGSFAAWLSAHLMVERTSLGIGRALVGPAEARHG